MLLALLILLLVIHAVFAGGYAVAGFLSEDPAVRRNNYVLAGLLAVDMTVFLTLYAFYDHGTIRFF